MKTSEFITPIHLKRKAIIYVRQSSPHQAISNKESLDLQYSLKQRAVDLGWKEQHIEIVDDDLGITGSSTVLREGFKNMLAEITLEKVGIILSYDVTRLSRNCTDWYQLLDLCAFKNCLIADRESIYNPSDVNGRMLLGFKGQLSEMELFTIRNRLTAGLLNKAKRGELALRLPVGLIRTEQSKVLKDPNKDLQDRIDLVFRTFLKLGSASKVLQFFNKNNLLLPRTDFVKGISWKKPSIAAVLSILKNPAYSGAFVYGKSNYCKKELNGKQKSKRLDLDEWKIVVKDKYPKYINWETFIKIQNMLKDNYAEYDRNKTRGVPRCGKALLHGIVYCGECGHKMVVQYKTGTRYLCNYLRQQYRVPVCQFIPADPIDNYAVEAFFKALSPAEIDLYTKALKSKSEMDQKVCKSHIQQIQRLNYEALLAEKRYRKVDPDNRLVADELEAQWEEALTALKKADDYFEKVKANQSVPTIISQKMKRTFSNIGKNLPSLWEGNSLTRDMKKKILRILVDKVIIQRIKRDLVSLKIVWIGGEITETKIAIHVGSFEDLSSSEKIKKIILEQIKLGVSDEDIASFLTQKGYKSPMADTFLTNTVKCWRINNKVYRARKYSFPRKIEGKLTIPQIAKRIDVKSHWVYHHINQGRILIKKDKETKLYLFPDNKKTIYDFKKFKSGSIKKLRY